ncbi:MAG: S41 family peptidase [Gemmatimonadota bacterium]|nr:S41 family peptidase [Gemmatimonadota bacterium]
MKRGFVVPVFVVALSVAAGGWLLQEGVERSENVYTRVRLVQEVVDRVKSSFVEEVDEETLYRSAIDGVIEDLGDPHSSFLPASDYENLRIRTEGEYGGVGLEIVDRDGYVTVVSPIPSSPGARAGLRPGDRFYEIDGVRADTMDTDQAVGLLRGEPGTEVDVLMLRPGVEDPIPFTLEREVIQLKAVPFALKLRGDVGYVPLQTVRETSSDEVRAAVDSLRSEGARALILDLRGNPGGLLDEGIAVTDLFLPEGEPIVETRGRDEGQSETFRAGDGEAYPDLPVLVLVDGTSASAAEIVAGALQDHDRAAVLGQPTFGKGSVQSLYRLSGGNVLRLTTARWYTPVGRSIDAPRDEDRDEAEDEALHALSISGQMVDSSGVGDRPEHRSLGGRTIYGGGGIVPDVVSVPETLSNAEARSVQRIFRRGGQFQQALFRFAVTYVREHPDLQPGFSLSSADLDAFYGSLPETGEAADREHFERAERFVRYHLEREIALQAWGEQGQFEQSARYDRQLEEALDLLGGVTSPDELFEVLTGSVETVAEGS